MYYSQSREPIAGHRKYEIWETVSLGDERGVQVVQLPEDAIPLTVTLQNSGDKDYVYKVSFLVPAKPKANKT